MNFLCGGDADCLRSNITALALAPLRLRCGPPVPEQAFAEQWCMGMP